MLFARCACSFAAEEKALPEARDTVIVPYDPKKPVKDQHPDKVYLKYDRFLELWEAAKANRAPVKDAPAAMAYALGAARYEGRVEEKRAAFSVTLDFATFDDAWVKVPLPFEGVRISDLAVDGKPAAFAEGALLVEKPGRHSLTASFEIPLAAGAREFAWGIPRTAATRVLLTLPETRWTARIISDSADAGVIERTVDGKKTVAAALGTTARITVSLTEVESAARVVEPATAEVETAALVLAGYERFETAITFGFADAQQDHFAVSFEKGLVLAMIEAPGMKSWKLTDSGEKQVLEVRLAEPAKGSFRLAFATERAQSEKFPATRRVPEFSPGARRVNRTVSLFSGAGVAVAAEPDAVLRQVQLANAQREGVKLAGAWTGAGTLGYRTTLAASGHEARVDYVYQVNRRKIELIASLQLHAKDAPLFDVSLTLPANFEVQAVDSARLQDWWRDGQKLRVRFKGETPETTPLVVYLVREYAAAPQQLDVQPLALDGFSKVTGEAVIAAHKGVSATLKLTQDGAHDAAKEVDPAKAAADFQILPPLERKRGFAFSNQKFSGEVALAALPVKQNATWMMHAEAHEAWLSLSMKAQITLRQGSIERTSFSLPATLPEAHVTGAEVRETRSRVEGARRIYDVQFQNDVHDTVDFTADVDLTMTEGKKADGRKVNEITLPAPEFPDAIITTGYVIADNASEYELKLETEGADKAQPSVIPWLPSVTKSAGIFRVQPVWKVALVLERLEKAEARTAFCAWAEMTTALREDGTEWHKAVWHLQNRSLQFLPVKLPDGAALMSVRVAGQNVRADSGTVNGRAVVLIPLIKTRPGDISYDVEAVWRNAGAKLAPRDTRKFADAELVGITVEQTFWNVWLPGSRSLTKSDGNMEEVIAVARDVEKARSVVEEMAALNSIIADPTISESARANAKQNWSMMCSQVQGILISNGDVLQSDRYSAAQESIEKKKERGELVKKLTDTNAYVGQQLAKVEKDNKDIEQRRGVQAGGGGANFSQSATVDMNGLVQTANNANAAQALLFGNNTYTGGTMINGGTLNTASGTTGIATAASAANLSNASNSAVSAGGVSIAQGTLQISNGAVNLNNSGLVQNGQNSRWNMNTANNAQPSATAVPGIVAADGNNLYVNDNVVLQQKKAGTGTLKITKSGAGTLTLAGANTFTGGAKGDRSFTSKDFAGVVTARDREAKSELAAAMPAKQAVAKDSKGADDLQDQGRSLNYARGNRQQQLDQAQMFANGDAQRPPAQQPMPQAMPQQPSLQALPQLRVLSENKPLSAMQDGLAMTTPGNRSGGTSISPNAIDALLAGTGSTPVLGVAVKADVVQPLGRLSLAVDFPEEGHVHHFQKAKANALLEISVADPALARRWTRVAIFAGLALLLAFTGRIFAARGVRRAV